MSDTKKDVYSDFEAVIEIAQTRHHQLIDKLGDFLVKHGDFFLSFIPEESLPFLPPIGVLVEGWKLKEYTRDFRETLESYTPMAFMGNDLRILMKYVIGDLNEFKGLVKGFIGDVTDTLVDAVQYSVCMSYAAQMKLGPESKVYPANWKPLTKEHEQSHFADWNWQDNRVKKFRSWIKRCGDIKGDQSKPLKSALALFVNAKLIQPTINNVMSGKVEVSKSLFENCNQFLISCNFPVPEYDAPDPEETDDRSIYLARMLKLLESLQRTCLQFVCENELLGRDTPIEPPDCEPLSMETELVQVPEEPQQKFAPDAEFDPDADVDQAEIVALVKRRRLN